MQHPIINEAKHALDLLSADPDVRDLAVRRELELQLREQERQRHEQERQRHEQERQLHEQERQLYEQDKVAARQAGLLEGSISKARLSLTKLLQLKFGELPPEARQRIEAASEPELDRWLERTITAPTLDSVFR